MARKVSALFAAVLAGDAASAAVVRSNNGAFLSTDDSERMRPDLVANTLVHVEEEWRKQAADFLDGSAAAAKDAPAAFAKSCGTVVSSIVQGSGGDRTVAKEYMDNVCNEKVLEGWHKLRCTALASAITEHAMLADNYANRHSLKAQKVCGSFWSVFVEAEKHREAEEAKLRAEKEKEQAEKDKVAAIAAAEAKKKADAEAKAEAERRAKEQARRDQEETEQKAKREAEEAKKRAAEAAARLAQKKAEAEEVAKEAQQKLEEAAKAEKEHQARLAEHKKAEDQLHSAKTAPTVVKAPKPATQTAKSVDAIAKTVAKAATQEKVAASAQKVQAAAPAAKTQATPEAAAKASTKAIKK